MPEPNLAQIDAVLRRVDREVWVVTAAAGGRRGGLTASFVQAASIDRERPLLMVGVARNHFTAELILASGSFAAHLLRSDQAQLAWNFASGSGRERDKLQGLKLAQSSTGSPLLADCLGACECRVVAQYDAGDRWYLWGEVVSAVSPAGGFPPVATGSEAAAQPLREQVFFQSLTSEQKAQLLADRDADVKIQRPLYEAWRNSRTV